TSRIANPDAFDSIQAVEQRHFNINDEELEVQVREFFQERLSVMCFENNLEFPGISEDAFQSVTEKLMVVGENSPYHTRSLIVLSGISIV
ncbi:MAG TPA: hypothetical protein VFI14_04615, partial [Chryseosolibacter sp.]|nr:hypothetical protein [Chryseosolibacter sp.]